MDGAIAAKTVTYDFERFMDGATLRKCSKIAADMISHMQNRTPYGLASL